MDTENIWKGEHVHVREDGTVYTHVHEHKLSADRPADEHETPHEHSHAHEYGTVHEHSHTHEHETVHDHGHMHEHSHEHADGAVHTHHGHTHTHEHTKAVLNRLSRAIGHLESIKRMVEDGRDCSEVLIQLSAVKSALNNTGKVILQDHIQHCLVDAVESGDMETIQELNRAIDRFIK